MGCGASRTGTSIESSPRRRLVSPRLESPKEHSRSVDGKYECDREIDGVHVADDDLEGRRRRLSSTGGGIDRGGDDGGEEESELRRVHSQHAHAGLADRRRGMEDIPANRSVPGNLRATIHIDMLTRTDFPVRLCIYFRTIDGGDVVLYEIILIPSKKYSIFLTGHVIERIEAWQGWNVCIMKGPFFIRSMCTAVNLRVLKSIVRLPVGNLFAEETRLNMISEGLISDRRISVASVNHRNADEFFRTEFQ
eukprot:TRINITY_DN51005_c0_g1_i1.p1 TRINITY_DN51005_c0_g1~~TRINITY_DN51005_c0_g1_i1.p1  ORF type:complete len:250 (-),score=47.11 TRINITY_DN51005_c0_g1_i1:325-1074(-)